MGTTFTVDASTTNTLVTHAYNAPGTYRVGVKYMDNDGQWSQPYPFTITIREVRRVFYVKDHLGNIRQSINESGTVVSAQDYYPYGEALRGYISVHPYEKYRFTEKERDIETNLDYFGARYYDSQLGIWGQVDPLWEKYHGWSTYNYTLNNPLNNFDPDGLTTWSVGLGWGVASIEGFGLMFSASFVWDDKGNIGILGTFGAGLAAGEAWKGGSVNISQNSQEDNIYGLQSENIFDVGTAIGLVGGIGGMTFSGEYNGNYQNPPSFSVGKGVGTAAYAMGTYSFLVKTWEAKGFTDVINNFNNGGYAIFCALELSVSVYDKGNNLIKKIFLNGEDKKSSEIPELKLDDVWKRDSEKIQNMIVPERNPFYIP